MNNEKLQLNLPVTDKSVAQLNLSAGSVKLISGSLPISLKPAAFIKQPHGLSVISNKLAPFNYNPVPSFKIQDTIYVVALGSAGFTAQRIKNDNRQERLNQIHRAWNIQVLKDFWSHLVAHPLPEEEIFAEFGFIIACRKFVIDSAGESKEVWDTTIWKVNQGEIKAYHQFISKQEPVPMTLKSESGKEERVFLLNDKEALHLNSETNEIELIQIDENSELISTESKSNSESDTKLEKLILIEKIA